MAHDQKDRLIRVRLTPKASRNGIRGWAADAEGKPVLKVSVTAVPEKGKANEALIELLARELKIPKKNISLTHGGSSRDKTLLIKGFSGDI